MLNPEGDIEKIYREFAKNYPLKTDDTGWDEFLHKMENAPVNVPAAKPAPGAPYAGFLKRYWYWLPTAALMVTITGVLLLNNRKESNPQPMAAAGVVKQSAPMPHTAQRQQIVVKHKDVEAADNPSKQQAQDGIQGNKRDIGKTEQPQKEAPTNGRQPITDRRKPTSPLAPTNSQTRGTPDLGTTRKQALRGGLKNGVAPKYPDMQVTANTDEKPLTGNKNITEAQNIAGVDVKGAHRGATQVATHGDGLTKTGEQASNLPSGSNVGGNYQPSKPLLNGKYSLPSGNQPEKALASSEQGGNTANHDGSDTASSQVLAAKPADSSLQNGILSGNTAINRTAPVGPANAEKHTDSATSIQPLVKVSTRDKSYFYFSLLAGPDLSTVKSQDVKHAGSNVGVLFGLYLGHHLSIETGFIHTEKKYYTSGEYFKSGLLSPPDRDDLKSVNTSSNFLEVPITLRYDLVQKKQYKIFINGGFSSYFTSNEKYEFIFQRPYGYEVRFAESDNLCNNIFSIVNLSAGLELRLNARNALRFEPYLKLPLSGIGAGSLPVTSSGLYINFTHSF
jgi:hypothetical protein